MHPNSLLLFKKHVVPRLRAGLRVLEISPDTIPSSYRVAAGDGVRWETLGLASAGSYTHPTTDEYTFPLPDESFDVIISGQVLEHVRKIWRWMPELARVCRRGGLVVTISPLSWPFHEAPVDCWRVFPEGMRALYEDAGLRVEHCESETLELDATRYVVPEEWWFPGARRMGTLRCAAARLLGTRVLVPGTSMTSGWRRLLRRLIGLPSSCAVDVVTIGSKP